LESPLNTHVIITHHSIFSLKITIFTSYSYPHTYNLPQLLLDYGISPKST